MSWLFSFYAFVHFYSPQLDFHAALQMMSALDAEKRKPRRGAGFQCHDKSQDEVHSTCSGSAKAQISYRGHFLPLSGKTEKGLFSVV